jgi:threonyl-tRNA synthetase
VVLHRAVTGTTERFMGVIIEHFAGAFPVWLSPVQAVIIPIADRHLPYVNEVAEKLRAQGLRIQVDDRNERMNAKIRDAQNQKTPYMLVIGDKEMEQSQVALRLRNGENPGPISLEAFIQRTKDDIEKGD